MATLYFKVGADYDKVIRLREEIKKLKAEMASFDGSTPLRTVKDTQKQINAATKESDKLLNTAAQSGFKLEDGFRRSSVALSMAQKNVDLITGRMIEQKTVVANLQSEVRRLAEAYRMVDVGSKKTANKQLSSAKSRLEDERVALNKLRSSQEGARLTVKGLRDEVSGYERTLSSTTAIQTDANSSFAKLRSTIIGAFAIQQAAQFIKSVAEVRGQFQQLEVAFSTLLKSKAKADGLMAEMVNLAAKTPFDLQGVADGARQLLAYGFASNQITDTLTRLGNVAAGLGLPLQRLTYLYGTTAVQGRLYARDMLQFTSSGIPILQEMAKMYGKTTEEINAMVTAGKVGFEDVKKVIENMTNSGGQFYNLMEEQSKTITGKISNLGDAWDVMLNNIGKSQEGVISGSIDMATSIVENYETIGKILAGLIATYGAYRAAVIATAAIQKISLLGTQVKEYFQLAKALGVATANQMAFNRTTLVNPYIAIAAAAVALGAVIYKVATAQSAFTKAQERLSEANQDVTKELTSEIQKLSILKRKLAEAKKGSEEFKSIKDTIVRDYGKYYAGLDIEIEKVENLSIAYDTLINKIRLSIGARKFESFYKTEQGNLDKTISDTLQSAYDRLTTKYGKDQGLHYYKEFFDSVQHGKAASYEAIKAFQETNFFDMRWGENAIDGIVDFRTSLDQARADINNTKKASTEAVKEFANLYQISEDQITSMLTGIPMEEQTKQLTSLKTLISDLKRDTKELNALNNQTEWTDGQKKRIGELEESLKKYKDEYKTLTGLDYGKTDNTAASKSQQQLSESILQVDLDLQAHRIAIMQDGRNKRLAEIDLEHQQTLAKVAKDKAEATKDKASPERLAKYDDLTTAANNKRNFSVQQTEIQYTKELSEWYRKSGDIFLTEEERKLAAVKERYATERKKLSDQFLAGNLGSGLTGVANYAKLNSQLDKGKGKETLQAEAEKYQKYAEQRLQIEQQFQNDVNQIREQNPNGGAEDEIEQRRAIADSDISAMATEIGVKEGEFTSFVDSVINRGIDELLRMISEAQSALDALGESGDPAKKTELSNRIKVAKIQLQNQKTETKQSANSDPAKKWKDTLSVMNDVKGITSDVISNFEGLDDATAAILNAAMNIATGVVNMIIGITTLAVSSATATTTTATVTSTAIQSVEKASIILAIISAALQVAQAIASLLVKDHELSEQTIKSYEAYMDITEKLIDQQKELMEVITGVQAVMAGEEGLKAIEKQEAATRKLGKAYLASRAKNKHSYGVETEERLRDDAGAINAAGFDWKKLRGSGRMEGLFDLSADEILRFQRELPEVWSQLDDDTRKYLQTIVDCKDKSKELSEALSEALTGFTLDDARSELIDFLNDADSTFEDVAENFEKTMMNSINRVIASGLDEDLKNWYKHVQDAMGDEEGLTEQELENLRKEREDIYKKAAAERDAAYEIAGVDPSGVSSDQESTKKGFETMTQDQASELNGRFTGLQMSAEQILAQCGMSAVVSTQMNSKFDAIISIGTDTRNIADEIRTIQVNSYLELQEINLNTRAIIKPITNMAADMFVVKQNTSKL